MFLGRWTEKKMIILVRIKKKILKFDDQIRKKAMHGFSST